MGPENKVELTGGTLYIGDCTIEIKSLEIVNEDGTSMDDFPKNPLAEKWKRLYPPTPMPQYSQVCDGYSCAFCGRCHRGDYWKVPDEDKEVWDDYLKQCREYDRIHNPKLYAMLYKGD